MKKYLSILLLAILFATPVFALDVPELKGRVNDYANMLKAQEVKSLEAKLEQHEKETSNQIVILTIPTLQGEVLEQFSIKVAEKWKIGQKDKDNGVILLIAKEERKLRIEVGKGLEGVLTDLKSGRIISEDIKPSFKNKNYYEGITNGTEAIMLAVKGEYKGDYSTKKKIKQYAPYGAFGVLMIIAGIAGFLHLLLGGIVGAVGAPIVATFFFHPGFPVLVVAAIFGFLIGLIARFILEYGVPLAAEIGFGGGGGGFGGGGASGDW